MGVLFNMKVQQLILAYFCLSLLCIKQAWSTCSSWPGKCDPVFTTPTSDLHPHLRRRREAPGLWLISKLSTPPPPPPGSGPCCTCCFAPGGRGGGCKTSWGCDLSAPFGK